MGCGCRGMCRRKQVSDTPVPVREDQAWSAIVRTISQQPPASAVTLKVS